jgi:hypothetical protein
LVSKVRDGEDEGDKNNNSTIGEQLLSRRGEERRGRRE